MISNGEFATDIAGWLSYDGDATLSHETTNPITGAGSLKVVTVGQVWGDQGAVYPDVEPGIAVTPGETLRLAFKVRGSEVATIRASFGYKPQGEELIWTAAISTDVDSISVDHLIPGDLGGGPTTHLHLRFTTTTAQETTFWVDDVSLGTPPA